MSSSYHNHQSPWLKNQSGKFTPKVFRNSPLRECITFSPENEPSPLPPSNSSINVVTTLDSSSCSISKAINLGKTESFASNTSSTLNLPVNTKNYKSSTTAGGVVGGGWENYMGSSHYNDEDFDSDEYSSEEESELAVSNLIKIQSSQIFSTPSFNQTLSKLFSKDGGVATSFNSKNSSKLSLNSNTGINQMRASSSSMSLNLNEMLKAATEQLKNFKAKKLDIPSSTKPYSGNHTNDSSKNISIVPVLSGEKLSTVSEELEYSQQSGDRLSSNSFIKQPIKSAKSLYSRRSYTMSEVNLSRLLITKSEIYKPNNLENQRLTAHSQPDLITKPSSNNIVDWLQAKLSKSSLSGIYRKRTSSVGLDLGGEDFKSKSNIGSIDNINMFNLEKGDTRDLEKSNIFRTKTGSFTDFLRELKPAKLSLMSKIHLPESPDPIILTKEHSMFSQNEILFMGDEKGINIKFQKPARWYNLRYWTQGDDKTERLYFIVFGFGFLFFPIWFFAYLSICLLPRKSSQTPNPMHTRWKSRFRLAFTIALWIGLLIALILIITHPNWFPKHNKVGVFGNVSTMGWDDNVLKDRMVANDNGVKINSKHH